MTAPTPAQLQALADLLARLVQDGELTEEQAIAVYLSYAADGTLLDEMLPLPPYLGIDREPESDHDSPILLLIIGAAAGIAIGRKIDAMGQRQRLHLADALADAHTLQASDLAQDLSAGRITVAEFQTALRTLNRTHAAGQVQLGAGSRAPLLRSTLENLAERESAFLQRFADKIAGNGLSGNPMSAEQIAARAAQYGGAGRAQFFRAAEGMTGDRAGWISHYVDRDDDHTCDPCHEARGYYLPGRGPYPGEICLGRHYCRCHRTTLYRPEIYARLMAGERVRSA